MRRLRQDDRFMVCRHFKRKPFRPIRLYEQGNFPPQEFLNLMIGKPRKLPAGRRRSACG